MGQLICSALNELPFAQKQPNVDFHFSTAVFRNVRSKLTKVQFGIYQNLLLILKYPLFCQIVVVLGFRFLKKIDQISADIN